MSNAQPPWALSATDRESLIKAALDAREFSYCPYSHFRVGVSVLTTDGAIIRGCNVENAAFFTICAERVAISKAVSDGHRSFVALAVATDLTKPTAPCGSCRQLIREFCSLNMPILSVPADYPHSPSHPNEGDSKTNLSFDGVLESTLGQLLPYSFGPEDLNVPKPK